MALRCQQPAVPNRTESLSRLLGLARRRLLFQALGLTLLLGLHPALAADRPAAFSRNWCAYQTQHFNLMTDLPRRRALAEIDRLNRFRQLFLALFPQADDQAGLPLRMLIFRRTRDFAELSGVGTFAGVTVPSLRAYQLLIGPSPGIGLTDTALHEYAHYLLRNQMDWNYPLWYEEGLASYLSAVRLRRRSPSLGHLNAKLRRVPGAGFAMSYAEVVAATNLLGWPQAKLTAFYERSWLLVHFIRSGHLLGYLDLRGALAAYLAQPRRDFAAAFRLGPTAMGKLVERYRRQRPLPVETVPLPEAESGAVRRRCLSAGESRLELAFSILGVNPQLAAAVLAEGAGKRDAEELTALSLALTNQDPDRAAAAVEQALRLEPDHSGAMVQQAYLKVRRCALSSDPACMANWAEAAALYRQAWEGNPERYDAAFGLGVAYLHTGRAEEAVRHLRLAYEKMPSVARTNFYLGEAYRILGDQRAAEHLRKARNWALEPLWRTRAEAALARLWGRY